MIVDFSWDNLHGPVRCRWTHLFSSLCNHSEPVLAKLGFPFLTCSRRKLSRTAFLQCLSESMRLFPTVRPCLVSSAEVLLWDHSDMKSCPLNLPGLGLKLHLPYLQLEPRHTLSNVLGFFFFFSSFLEFNLQDALCFIPLPLWDTHTRVVPVSAGMFIPLSAAF